MCIFIWIDISKTLASAIFLQMPNFIHISTVIGSQLIFDFLSKDPLDIYEILGINY